MVLRFNLFCVNLLSKEDPEVMNMLTEELVALVKSAAARKCETKSIEFKKVQKAIQRVINQLSG